MPIATAVTRILAHGTTPLELVAQFRYLGRDLQNNGGCDMDHKRKWQRSYGAVIQLARFLKESALPRKVKAMLAQQQVWSAGLYSCETWTLSQKQRDKLQSLQVKSLRWTLGIRPKVTRAMVDGVSVITSFTQLSNERVMKIAGVGSILDAMDARQRKFAADCMNRHEELPERAAADVRLAGAKTHSRQAQLYELLRNRLTDGATAAISTAPRRQRTRAAPSVTTVTAPRPPTTRPRSKRATRT